MNDEIGEQKSISLNRLEGMGAVKAPFGRISDAIEQVLGQCDVTL